MQQKDSGNSFLWPHIISWQCAHQATNPEGQQELKDEIQFLLINPWFLFFKEIQYFLAGNKK